MDRFEKKKDKTRKQIIKNYFIWEENKEEIKDITKETWNLFYSEQEKEKRKKKTFFLREKKAKP